VQPVDDLGTPRAGGAPQRVVSLVPSLTEALGLTVPDLLVGATQWCTQPPGLEVTRVRGTKNPDLAAIGRLTPDLVVMNKEENRRVDVERLRAAGIGVWVTVIETVDQALDSLRRLFTEALERPVPAWLDEAAAVWSVPPPLHRLSAAVPVWRDPWMVVGGDTFVGDLLSRVGVDNVFDADGRGRYPAVDVAEIAAQRPDVVLLPDEPYAFTAVDGPEALPGLGCLLVSGRHLSWYGPSMLQARPALEAALAAVRSASSSRAQVMDQRENLVDDAS